MTLRVRPMTRSDLDLAIAWAAAEGWRPSWADGDELRARIK
ncbi:hypothetical protein [Parathermosynechococcus lividus]